MIVIDDDRFLRSGLKATRCVTDFRRYENGQLALTLFTEDGEPWATASVALVGEYLPQGCLFIKDYGENEGMAKLLQAHGVIEAEPVKTVRSNFEVVSAYRLTEAALREVNC